MLSLRSFSRALPKSSILRCTQRTSLRSLSALHRPTSSALLRAAASQRVSAIACARKAFGSSAIRMEEASEGSTDQELSATLASELQLERESTDSADLPAELQEFLTTSEFQVQDTAGDEEVVLTKQFGNENIRITFSVADLSSEHDPDAFLQDRAMQDEPYEDLDPSSSSSPGKNINSGSSSSFATAPEDSVADADRSATGAAAASGDPDASSISQDDAGFPVNMQITLTKAGVSGALHFGVVAHDGAVAIERVSFFQDAEHADAPTAEMQWAARNKYTGPPFGNLDEGLQEVLERFLEERGINTSLALWVPEYVEWKEQREYMGWLEGVRGFVDA